MSGVGGVEIYIDIYIFIIIIIVGWEVGGIMYISEVEVMRS